MAEAGQKIRRKFRIRKGDRVVVLTGRSRGVVGEVLKMLPGENRVIVQGVNRVKRHTRPSQRGPGGIETREAPVHISNVSLIDPESGKPTRVRWHREADGRKVRVAVRSSQSLDL